MAMNAPIGAAATQRERSILIGLGLDMSMLLPYAVISVWSNSLTLMGETLRGGIFIALEIALLVTLRRIHRGRTSHYDFGAGKIEQFASLMVGTSLFLGAAWIMAGVIQRAGTPPSQSSLGLGFAVAISVVNLGMNLYALRAVWLAGRDGTSIIMGAQIRARLSKVVASALVVVAILVNAIAGPGGIGAFADLAGAALVVAMMVTFGVGMWREALPSLLDRTLDEQRQAAINRALAQHFDAYEALGPIRARVSGRDPMIEIALGFAPHRSMAEVQAVADAIRADLEQLIPGARVTLAPFAAR